MEDDGVSESSSVMGEVSFTRDELSHITYTEQFISHLPFYLSIGMTYEQYWNDDCCLVKYYRKAFEIQQDRINERLWLQGAYIYQALGAMLPALRPMSKEPPKDYLSEPYPRTEKQVREKKQMDEKKKYDNNKAIMDSLVVGINKSFEEKGDDVNE